MKSKFNWTAAISTIVALALMYKDIVTSPLAQTLLGMTALALPVIVKFLTPASGTISSNGIDYTGGIYLVNFLGIAVYLLDLILKQPLWGGLVWPLVAANTITVIIRSFFADSPENLRADRTDS